MYVILGAALGALAAIGIPLVTWVSRRATSGGRLAIQVERLGIVYALMPDSSEKETFKLHLIKAIRNLNAWLDIDATQRRKVIQLASAPVYLVGVVLVVAIALGAASAARPWISFGGGAVVGLAVGIVGNVTASLFDRHARQKKSQADKETEDAAASVRFESIRTGEPPRAPSTADGATGQ
jgi:hypothetical protein